MNKEIEDSFNKLINYCERESFKGYDPYDGLNSTLLKKIPLISKNRIVRLVWIQTFKRSPLNFRVIAGIKKEFNPKALGLFLSGYCNLYKRIPEEEYLDKIHYLSKKILEFENKDYSGSCWGYNFDWQARAFFQPKYNPTVVVTTFISCALLDAFEITRQEKLLQIARSSCNFVLKDLNRIYDDYGDYAFSYSPLDNSAVYNASLLGSKLLSRVYDYYKEMELLEAAEKSVAYCCKKQRADGSWTYGDHYFHQWIDNFHTGYNLECIGDYIKFSDDFTYKEFLLKGLEYYLNTFFTGDGISKYYNNSIYPIDIHAPAQLIITLTSLKKFNEYRQLIDNVLSWTIKNMQSDKGYFYFQLRKYFSSKISYMRWAQSWMVYALSKYMLHIDHNNKRK